MRGFITKQTDFQYVAAFGHNVWIWHKGDIADPFSMLLLFCHNAWIYHKGDIHFQYVAAILPQCVDLSRRRYSLNTFSSSPTFCHARIVCDYDDCRCMLHY